MNYKQYSLFFLVILTFQSLSAQVIKEQNIHEYYTSFRKVGNEVGLPDLLMSTNGVHIRIWDFGRIIEIDKIGDSIKVKGYNYIFSNTSKKRDPKHSKTILKKKSIDESIIKSNDLDSIFQEIPSLFKKFDNLSAVSDSLIKKGYQIREGGITDAFEYSNDDYYYCGPMIRNLKMKKMIDSLFIGWEKIKRSDLPKSAWYSYGGTTSVYSLTWLEYIQMKLFGW